MLAIRINGGWRRKDYSQTIKSAMIEFLRTWPQDEFTIIPAEVASRLSRQSERLVERLGQRSPNSAKGGIALLENCNDPDRLFDYIGDVVQDRACARSCILGS